MSQWDCLTERLRLGAISRRAFMARATALGLSAPLAIGATGSLGAPAAETPKRGGTLRLALAGGSRTDRIEPASYADSVMISVGRGLFNGLVELTAEGRLAPELSSSWEARNGAVVWVFNLRKGVKFSNGQEFTADDAIYSLNLHRGESVSRASAAMKAVNDIKKLDKNQIQITLGAPDADFPAVLTDPHLLMAPDGFKDWSRPIGTGAFVLDKFDPGVRIALKRAGDYWKEGRGHLDAAEITVIGDWSERLDALISGQADIVNRVDHRTVGLFAKTPRLNVIVAPGGWHAVLAMEMDKPPYDNLDIRLALKYAVDREQILKALFGGYGALGNDHPIPSGDPYFNKDLPQRKRDPDKAAFHLKKSGLDPTLLLQASDAAFPGAVDVAALVQSSAGKAGLKIELKNEPVDGFWDNVWLKAAFVENCWKGRAAATQILWDVYRAGAPLNESHWKNDRFEQLLVDARSETDEGKRKGYIWEMQAILHEDGSAVIPVFRDWIDASRDILGGHTPHGGFEMDNGYILDKAFFKA
ncbi:ABC transporter substrate-binding protein [Methylocapsa sp. S129]|uniref:ABC transporter substrate-binding protein n=1 Tax=Methylocapsa sp. S129 TaxID=1641869 RepID=UPI00131AD280|nr:ABC transporter substrate-binding protein [Methylocapsa sp. S129]